MTPAHIKHPAAYRRAAISAIKRNAAKTALVKWTAEHSDSIRLKNWLDEYGEFAPWWEISGRKVEDHEICSDGYCDDPDAKYVYHPMITHKPGDGFGVFLRSMKDQLQTYGKLSPKQTDVVRKAFAKTEKYVDTIRQRKLKYAAEAAKSEWVGNVGDRVMFTTTLQKVLAFEGHYGWSYINIMRDADGNIIIGKGSKRYGVEGTTIVFKATIKDHAIRNSAKQTVVNRPAFSKLVEMLKS